MDARCSRCHRPLTNPVHAAAGIGPTCAAKLGLEFKRPAKAPRKRCEQPARKIQPVEAPMLPFEVPDISADDISAGGEV